MSSLLLRELIREVARSNFSKTPGWKFDPGPIQDFRMNDYQNVRSIHPEKIWAGTTTIDGLAYTLKTFYQGATAMTVACFCHIGGKKSFVAQKTYKLDSVGGPRLNQIEHADEYFYKRVKDPTRVDRVLSGETGIDIEGLPEVEWVEMKCPFPHPELLGRPGWFASSGDYAFFIPRDKLVPVGRQQQYVLTLCRRKFKKNSDYVKMLKTGEEHWGEEEYDVEYSPVVKYLYHYYTDISDLFDPILIKKALAGSKEFVVFEP